MPEHSPAQKQYLLRVRRKKYMIHVSRILLFLGFLFLWEVSARRRWIDSFIFSSPSEIWQTFFTMIQDQSLFTHIGITLTETLVSFVQPAAKWLGISVTPSPKTTVSMLSFWLFRPNRMLPAPISSVFNGAALYPVHMLNILGGYITLGLP